MHASRTRRGGAPNGGVYIAHMHLRHATCRSSESRNAAMPPGSAPRRHVAEPPGAAALRARVRQRYLDQIGEEQRARRAAKVAAWRHAAEPLPQWRHDAVQALSLIHI